jgi:hypothetical protein
VLAPARDFTADMDTVKRDLMKAMALVHVWPTQAGAVVCLISR